jgi:hypothetical protein
VQVNLRACLAVASEVVSGIVTPDYPCSPYRRRGFLVSRVHGSDFPSIDFEPSFEGTAALVWIDEDALRIGAEIT